WRIDGVIVASGDAPGLAADAVADGDGSFAMQGFHGQVAHVFHTAELHAGTYADFSFPWSYLEGTHTVTFEVVPGSGIPEVSTRNNARTEWTDAMAFFITVRRSAYNAFRLVQNHTDDGTGSYPPGYASYSFEDWLQYHVDLMHDKFRKSVYPTAPSGVLEH